MAPMDGDRSTSKACHQNTSEVCSRLRLSSYKPIAANGPIKLKSGDYRKKQRDDIQVKSDSGQHERYDWIYNAEEHHMGWHRREIIETHGENLFDVLDVNSAHGRDEIPAR